MARMKEDQKAKGNDRFLVRWLNLPPSAAEALEDQRNYRKGVRRQKVRLPGWIGAPVLLAGVVLLTAQQVEFSTVPVGGPPSVSGYS
jgi:hypothetical protein